MDAPPTGLSTFTGTPLATAPQHLHIPSAGEIPGHRLRFRRIFILPTREGMGFAVAVSVMLLGSINYGNALGYVLSFLLVGAALVSMLHAVRNLAGLQLSGEPGTPVFAGDAARFKLRLDNRGARQRCGLLARLGGGWRRRQEKLPVLHFGLDADSIKTIEIAGATSTRGWCRPGPVTIATRFPLGLFRAWSHSDIGLQCLVYPRPTGAQPLPESRTEDAASEGLAGTGEDEFAGLRDYQAGDSARRIHWKAVAQGRGVPVKLFSGADSGVTLLRWQDVADGNVEGKLSQLCRWVLDAEARNQLYAVCIPGLDIAPGRGEQHRHQCLQALALYEDTASG